MYADDTNITLVASDLNVLEREMNNELKNNNKHLAHGEQVKSKCCQNWFYVNWHSPNITVLGSKQVKIQIEGENISQDEKAKSLCVLIDDNLT